MVYGRFSQDNELLACRAGGVATVSLPKSASLLGVVVTLINAMRQRGAKKGVAALCIGGGEATALAIELP